MTWTLEERTAALELAVAKIEENLKTLSMEFRDHEYGHAPKA